jgi:hypothetical protein
VVARLFGRAVRPLGAGLKTYRKFSRSNERRARVDGVFVDAGALQVRRALRVLLTVLFMMLAAGWLFGTPWFWMKGAFTTFFFPLGPFTQGPTRDQLVEAVTMLHWSLACGLLLPVAGLVLALATKRPVTAWFFVYALAISVVLMLVTGTFQFLLKDVIDGIRGPAPIPTPTPTPCAEHSGGVPRCPGD